MSPITIETTLAPGHFPGTLLHTTAVRCAGETLHSEKLVHQGVSIDALGYIMDSQKATLRAYLAQHFTTQEVET